MSGVPSPATSSGVSRATAGAEVNTDQSPVPPAVSRITKTCAALQEGILDLDKLLETAKLTP